MKPLDGACLSCYNVLMNDTDYDFADDDDPYGWEDEQYSSDIDGSYEDYEPSVYDGTYSEE